MTAPRYIDPIAVERAMAGDRVRLTKLERRAAVQQMSRRRLSAKVIAERLGISSRTVVRCRSYALVEVSAIGS